ncbi:hypothetical protein CDV31_004673 [Fusarium ambrosium]|uniref:WH2 domain-containing protein n=1 Tax=Fusarium ambrosium TaxID=131363 RepID=A0A428UP59_9HYPO|nr:hypothetical protein CDV31_004673 [Fusarium ambrosium]
MTKLALALDLEHRQGHKSTLPWPPYLPPPTPSRAAWSVVGPPPPPPPPPGGLPGRPAAGGLPNRGALLSDIHKGRALKKAVTNDRSAPQVGGNSSSSSSGPPIGGAPPVPMLGGAPKPPGGLAPPVPGNRARSNSDQGSRDATGGGVDAAPQLGGLFAGGMPKLKKRGGGIDTGANSDSTYLSDPEPTTSAPRPPTFGAPKPPAGAAPAIPGRPPMPPAGGSNLRKTTPIGSKPPPPPIGKKPPPLPTSRKPSSMSLPPSVPSAPAPPPPPPPVSSAPAPPGPPTTSPFCGASPSKCISYAASTTSPASSSTCSVSLNTLACCSSRHPRCRASISKLRAAPSAPIISASTTNCSFTAASANGAKSPSPAKGSPAQTPGATGGSHMVINDTRWHFKDEGLFPKPRDFVGGTRKYRAGRGSSVPLDLSAL